MLNGCMRLCASKRGQCEGITHLLVSVLVSGSAWETTRVNPFKLRRRVAQFPQLKERLLLGCASDTPNGRDERIEDVPDVCLFVAVCGRFALSETISDSLPRINWQVYRLFLTNTIELWTRRDACNYSRRLIGLISQQEISVPRASGPIC